MKRLILLLSICMLLGFVRLSLDQELRQALIKNEIQANTEKVALDSAKVELGRMLFYDKILSGNKDISCASCHHPKLHSGDALALPTGVGGTGLGEERIMGEGREHIP